MIVVEPHWLHGWCTWWPEGLSGPNKDLWADICRMHDIMGTLSELDYGEEVLCEGEIFSWKRLGFDTPPSQLWQDAWLRMSIYTRAMLHPGLSDEDRDKVRRNAEIMFLGLRTFGVPFRVLT